MCRQEKLLQLAEKFARKAALRESWLSDMSQVLQELDKGQDVTAVDAALKRHEAISADVHAGVSERLYYRSFIRKLSNSLRFLPTSTHKFIFQNKQEYSANQNNSCVPLE